MMRYSKIDHDYEVCNGYGWGISLYTQGCPFRCENCFNQETWDYNGGYIWDDNSKNELFDLLKPSYIKRLSILGGEPLIESNLNELEQLILDVKKTFPDINIWIYTGFKLKELNSLQNNVIKNADYIVDGRFIKELYNPTLKFKGSSNQKIWKKENGNWKEEEK